ncbi:MAG: sugar phosphate isomerase/epimerase family protein [Psychromonas sp.]
MSMLNKLAINTAIFDGHNIKVSLQTIRKLGINHVEFAFNQGYVGHLDNELFSTKNAKNLLRLMDNENLTSEALGCTMNLAAPTAIEDFKLRIDFATQIGATYLNTCTGAIADRKIIIENLQELAIYAEDKGRVICLENGGDLNFNAFASAHDGVRLLSEVDHQSVALNFDPGNSVSLVPNLSPSEEALIALPFCQHFHLKDVAVHDDMFTFPALGEGIVNFKPIMKVINNRQLAFSIEKPLRMYRRKDSFAVRDASTVDINVIETTLQKSIQHLSQLIG